VGEELGTGKNPRLSASESPRAAVELRPKAAARCDELPRAAADESARNRACRREKVSVAVGAELLKNPAANCVVDTKLAEEDSALLIPWLAMASSVNVGDDVLKNPATSLPRSVAETVSDCDALAARFSRLSEPKVAADVAPIPRPKVLAKVPSELLGKVIDLLAAEVSSLVELRPNPATNWDVESTERLEEPPIPRPNELTTVPVVVLGNPSPTWKAESIDGFEILGNATVSCDVLSSTLAEEKVRPRPMLSVRLAVVDFGSPRPSWSVVWAVVVRLNPEADCKASVDVDSDERGIPIRF